MGNSGMTNKGKASIDSHAVDWLADTIKVMLMSSAFVPSVLHNFVSDLVASEVSSPSYVGGFGGSGRRVLTGKTVTQDNVGNASIMDAADVTWPSLAGVTPAWAVIIKEVSSDANSIVLGWIDFPDTVSLGTDYTVAWAAGGIFKKA